MVSRFISMFYKTVFSTVSQNIDLRGARAELTVLETVMVYATVSLSYCNYLIN